MKPFAILAASTLLFFASCSSSEQRTHVVEKFENGMVKVERTFAVNGQDSVPIGETTFYKTGATKLQGSLNENGEREGEWKAYFTNGQIWSEGSFEKGLREGKSIVYFPNGQKRSEGNYQEGKQVGNWKFWSETGELVEEKTFAAH